MTISESPGDGPRTGQATDDLYAGFDHFTSLTLDEDPIPMLRAMREQCPIGYSEAYDGSWVLTGYQDIWNAARDTATFSSARGVSVPSHGMPPLPPIESDPPVHMLFRGPLISRFSPAAVATNEPHAREVVTQLIDAFIDDGAADLAQQLTVPLPAIVNTPVIGIPVEAREKFQAWAVTLLASGGQDVEAIMSCMGYFAELYEVRKREPADDTPTLMLSQEIDGQPIDQSQFALIMIMLMAAGLDTTTNSGSHMLYYLAQHPEQRRLLAEEPDRIPAAVEELLRHLTPLPALFRTATHPVALHGKQIAEGERVQLCWMAGNHDPAEFPDPETVRLDRKPNRHLSFGIGPHRCLGAHLARLELKVLLEEALPRLGDYRVVSPPTRYRSVTRGISNLHVVFPPGMRSSAT